MDSRVYARRFAPYSAPRMTKVIGQRSLRTSLCPANVQEGLACSMPLERAELKVLHGTLTRLVAGLREATADQD